MLSLIVVVVFVIVMLVSSVLFVRLIFDMDLSIGDETEPIPWKIRLYTKYNIIKWKKRVFVEKLIYIPNFLVSETHRMKFRNKTYILEGDYVLVEKKGKETKRYNKSEKILKILNKKECETYIPQLILDNPNYWDESKINIIREFKLKRILEDV